MSNCYLNFPLEEDFSKWFGFRFKGQSYKFNRMPFGWTLSPYLCIKFMKPIETHMKEGFPDVAFHLYMDDMLMTSNNIDSLRAAMKYLHKFFERISLKLNSEKS